MTTKTVYVAADGTIFDREDECQDYETELTEKTICGINFHGEKISFRDPYFIVSIQAVCLPTKDAIDLFLTAATANKVTTSGIDKPGIYALSMDIDSEYRWEYIDTVIADYELAISQLKECRDALQQ